MSKPIDLSSYLTEAASLLDNDSEGHGNSSSRTSEEDWFEQAASDFLAQGPSDPVLEDILEATRVFTRKNFSLRAGYFYRQQLQNTPSYEVVCELEASLVQLAGVANWLAANPPLDNTHYMGSAAYQEQQLVADEWKAQEAAHTKEVLVWAIEMLAPKLEGTHVIKVTRSTKKPNSAVSRIPEAVFTALALEYKELIATIINPKQLLPKLVAGQAWNMAMQSLASNEGSYVSALTLFNILWSKKEQNQWAYGLVEYANALVGLVAYAQSRDPQLKPRKYLCYFQKKAEATLYRGQEELDAMVATMQADNLLTTHTQEPKPEYETQYRNPRVEAEGSVTANPAIAHAPTVRTQRELSKTRRHIEAASSGKQGFIVGAGDKEADAKNVTTSTPLTLSQKLAAKRAAKQQQL